MEKGALGALICLVIVYDSKNTDPFSNVERPLWVANQHTQWPIRLTVIALVNLAHGFLPACGETSGEPWLAAGVAWFTPRFALRFPRHRQLQSPSIALCFQVLYGQAAAGRP